ncbi:glycosyl hydrolase [Colletotrichum tofieldiae]|uniref:Glycosyl hydrolase n=1 Tax=Colletotrichum tofieldiae TaxID=708197 RepID=A0A161W4C5_9PEZI|nr:glycosyl hydrolase [Colletotrichum tofieldiae]
MSSTLHTAAIPAATVQSHASNLLQLPDKSLLCAWFGGSQEGLPDVSIWLSRQEPGSASWSTPQKISSDTNRSCQNPVLFQAPKTGAIWLFHTSQDAGNQDGAFIMARTSSDNGITWSEPRFPLKGITGVWIGNSDISAVYYSRDDGQTWAESVVPDSVGCVHMNLISPAKEGCEYIAFFRSRWADNIYRSTSTDGLCWAPPMPTTLPNPNSGICATRLSSETLIMVFNRSAAEPSMAKRGGLYDDITPEDDKRPNQSSVDGKSAIWGTPRKTLTVAISCNDGLTWKERVLEEGDGFCMTNNSIKKTNRELSYPSIFVEKEGSLPVVHVAFTFHRQYIKYVKIEDLERWVGGV